MNRRNFLKICGVTGVVYAVTDGIFGQKLYANDGRLYEAYEKVLLEDEYGHAIKLSSLIENEAYIFHYPHVGTPCFLINLTESSTQKTTLTSEKGEEYVWEEGIGNKRQVVAYSAICTHSLTHPTKRTSMINYTPKGAKTFGVAGSIICSAHISSFDPSHGGKVVGGPANEPLASIVLEHDTKTDKIYAIGVLGSDKFHKYFKTFKREMKKDYGSKRKAKKLVKISVPTVTLKQYSKNIISY